MTAGPTQQRRELPFVCVCVCVSVSVCVCEARPLVSPLGVYPGTSIVPRCHQTSRLRVWLSTL